MTADEIRRYLTELNDGLHQMDIKGEVSIYRGAVMCLVYDARPPTKDVDAVFRPTSEIRQAIDRIANRHGLPLEEVFAIVEKYCSRHQIKPATQYFIEELFEK